jgi:RNA polymerase sigma-70 factor (ECF subfamily)
MTLAAHPLTQAESDSELIARIARGELAALGELFDRHEPTVRRYLSRLGLSRGDADDVVQSVFLEVVGSAARFDSRFAARSWLFGIATMLVRRQRRSALRHAARLLNWSHWKRQQVPQSPEESYESDQTLSRFNQAFARLSPKKKEVFALVVLEGMSGQQAADILSIPVNTVWTRLHHARAELRQEVGEFIP